MNTDASNVEDINIHQIIERLSMYCIESSGERFNICRNRSFTLFWNERYFEERSDSVAVAESMSMSMTNFFHTGLTVLVPDISPEFPTWEDHLSSMFHAEEFDEQASITGLKAPVCCTFKRAQWNYLTFRFGVHRVFRCSRSKHPYTASRHQIHQRLWFCCDSFFTCIFSCSFRHRTKTVDVTEMADLEQTQKTVPFITCAISLGQYVCELGFWCQYTFLWFESWDPNWFYQATNQEQLFGFWKRFSLSGLLPFLIILITASLSSVMHNTTSSREEFAFEETKSTLFRSFSWNFLSRWRCRQVHLHLFSLIRISVKNSNDQIPQVKRGYTDYP